MAKAKELSVNHHRFVRVLMKIEVQMFKVIVRRKRYPDNYDFYLIF